MVLCNAPLIFQRMVNTLFYGVIGKGLFVYLDDRIVVSKDLDSHLQQLSGLPEAYTSMSQSQAH